MNYLNTLLKRSSLLLLFLLMGCASTQPTRQTTLLLEEIQKDQAAQRKNITDECTCVNLKKKNTQVKKEKNL